MNSELIEKSISHKTPGWLMKTKSVEIFLTEDGGQHAPVTFFKDSEKPVQPYYLSQWQDERPDLSACPLLQNLRGDFFCLPFGGNGAAVNGEQHQCHGETSTSAWTFVNAEAKDGRTTFEFSMDTKVHPAHVTKKYEVIDGQSVLYVTHTVTMDGRMPYGHHTIIQMPEKDETMLFSVGKFDFGMTPTSLFSDPANLEYQYLASGAEFSLVEAIPTKFTDEATHDFSVYPSPVGYADLFAMFKKPAPTPAWAAAVYPSRGYMFFSLKNAEELPATTIWTSNSGRYGFPWNGKTRCFGLEETCSYFADGYKPSIEKNVLNEKGWKTCGEFSKDKPFAVHHIQGVVRVSSGFGKVVNASFTKGKVTFTDEEGHSVTTAVNWEFLGTK